MFWRHKKNDPKGKKPNDEDEKDLINDGEPEIEKPLEADKETLPNEPRETIDDGMDKTRTDLDEMAVTPVPDAAEGAEDRQADMHETQEQDPEKAAKSEGGGWWSRLTSGLSKSSNKLTQGISDLVTKKKLDQDMLDALEELLITADLGPKTAARLVEELSKDRYGKDITQDEVKHVLADSITRIMEPVSAQLSLGKADSGPRVVLVCGVNGVGKTTTIGKLAHQIRFQSEQSVVIAAGDTFRAAAIEQLKVWGERTAVPVVSRDIGADAASVAYEAYEKAKSNNADIVMIDTAGRLHNKSHLMDELQKIARVLKKQDETAPHEVLLVLDATTGQNAHEQVRIFKDMLNVTGLVVTKLDGSARGGVLVSLADEFKLPVYAIGVGEKAEDMQAFHPQEFARALLGIEK